MGKSQKKRTLRRHNPVRVPDSSLPKGLQAAASASSKRDAILPLIQKLEGADAQERTWACSAVSNLIQNDPSTRRLLQGKNIVGSLITRLSDSIEEVVIEAAGALRNLCVDGGYDICAEMYNKNILTPLKMLIEKIANTLQQLLASPKSAPESAANLVYGFAENVITIIWCLSETSNKALNAINQLSLIPFLMAFLENRTKLSARTVAAAAQCLYVLTDDNSIAIEEIRANSTYSSCLLDIATNTSSVQTEKAKELINDQLLSSQILKVLAAGILKNVSPFPSPSFASSVDLDKTIVLPLLTPMLTSVSLPEISDRVTVLLSQKEETVIEKTSPKKHGPKTDHKSSSEYELEYLERTVRAIELVLEILTSVCATLPDPEPDVINEKGANENEDDIGEEIEKEGINEMDVDGDIPQTNGHTHLPDSPNLRYLQNIVEPVLSLIHPVGLSFPPISNASLSNHPPTTSALSAVHVRAMECLNNVFLSLSVSAHQEVALDLESGRKIWDAVWNALSRVGLDINGAGQEKRKEMWEIGVGVLWGMGNVWRGRIIPDPEQIQVLMEFCNVSNNDVVKVKCVGTLECLAQYPDSVEANNVIASYLLSLLPQINCSSSTPVEPVLQAASALIDIYSDENSLYDINFRKGDFLIALFSSVDGMKKMVKSIDMRKEGGRPLRRHGQEVLDNLIAFIEYRKNLRL